MRLRKPKNLNEKIDVLAVRAKDAAEKVVDESRDVTARAARKAREGVRATGDTVAAAGKKIKKLGN